MRAGRPVSTDEASRTPYGATGPRRRLPRTSRAASSGSASCSARRPSSRPPPDTGSTCLPTRWTCNASSGSVARSREMLLLGEPIDRPSSYRSPVVVAGRAVRRPGGMGRRRDRGTAPARAAPRRRGAASRRTCAAGRRQEVLAQAQTLSRRRAAAGTSVGAPGACPVPGRQAGRCAPHHPSAQGGAGRRTSASIPGRTSSRWRPPSCARTPRSWASKRPPRCAPPAPTRGSSPTSSTTSTASSAGRPTSSRACVCCAAARCSRWSGRPAPASPHSCAPAWWLRCATSAGRAR